MTTALERKAEEEFSEHGAEMAEVVGIGFISDSGVAGSVSDVEGVADAEAEGLLDVWYELENEAGPGEFYVSAETLAAVFAQAVADGVADRPRVLWHSHVNTVEPSQDDILEFPIGIVQAGLVYHIPTQTTVAYNEQGMILQDAGISAVDDNHSSDNATQE